MIVRGSDIDYSLRPNKYVERRLFIELLNILCQNHADEYVYISMAGPQLADLIQVHFEVGIKKLVSIEADDNVLARQEFNIRPGCMTCLLQTSGEFVTNFNDFEGNYEAGEKFIVWLDYADSSQRYQQLVELETLVASLNAGDVVKITLNGNFNTIKAKISEAEKEQLDLDDLINLTNERKKAHIRSCLGKYKPTNIDDSELDETGFLRILANAVSKAINYGIKSLPNVSKLLVGTFSYNDGYHTMLTVTAKLVSDDKLEEETEFLRRKWDYMPESNDSVVNIEVPSLTIKERLFLESLFFKEPIDVIFNRLPFRLDIDQEASMYLVSQYEAHYRRYPGFLPIRI